jgi:hypothetical protein
MMLSKVWNQFSFKDCTYGIEWYKTSSARAVVWEIINTPNVFTIETSFHGYEKHFKTEHFLPNDLFNLGNEIARTMYLYTVGEDFSLF